MNTLTKSICILVLGFISIARSEVQPPKKDILSGAEAFAEIQVFMTKRWHRQTWQIEHKSIAGLPDAPPVWHVKGTPYWVRLDGPEDLKGRLNLNGLDTTQVYEFTGIAVDQCYSVITFYALSAPKISPMQKSK